MRSSSSSRRVRRGFRPLLLELEGRVVPSFVAPLAFDAGRNPFSVAVADFYGDGVLDLVVTSGTVRVLLGTGDGAFRTTHISYVAGGSSTSVAVADFNGDGVSDLAIANSGSNDISILLNDGVWTGPGGSPGGGRSPRGGTAPPALEGFAAEALVSRPAPGAMLSRPLPSWRDSPEPTNRATRPPADQPAARAVRSALVSWRGTDAFFAHGERAAADIWAAFGVGAGRG